MIYRCKFNSEVKVPKDKYADPEWKKEKADCKEKERNREEKMRNKIFWHVN